MSSNLVVGSASSAFQPVAPSVSTVSVKRDGMLVDAEFKQIGRVRDIILDYAGKPGEDTYETILHNVVLPLESAAPDKMNIFDINVHFPKTGEGFSRASPWVEYFYTGLPKHFARTLERMTKDIPGRIEIQIQQVSGT